MPKCTESRIGFGKLGRRAIEADFSGGELSSDGGLMLLKQVDECIGLTRSAAGVLSGRTGAEGGLGSGMAMLRDPAGGSPAQITASRGSGIEPCRQVGDNALDA